MVGHLLFEEGQVGSALAAADDLAVALRGQHVHAEGETVVVGVAFHVEGFDRRRVAMHDDGPVVMPGQERLVAAAEVAAPLKVLRRLAPLRNVAKPFFDLVEALVDLDLTGVDLAFLPLFGLSVDLLVLGPFVKEGRFFVVQGGLALVEEGEGFVAAQQRSSSPRGKAATQVGGEYEGRRYTGGKWIEVDYGRPILRGRSGIFGEGEGYGQRVNAGAPVWRVGANQSTRLMTEVALKLGDKVLPAGEYSLFVDLKGPDAWTLIRSNHKAQETFNRNEKVAIWGSYGYKPDHDVARAAMKVRSLDHSVDQMTISFVDVDDSGATLAVSWEKTMATTRLKVAK